MTLQSPTKSAIIENGTNHTDTDIYNADFETAVSAAKFGRFNVKLFLLAILAGWTGPFEVFTISYVLSAAQCDLDLSLNDKGTLNAVVFLGMVASGFVWGFLTDTYGRKKVMVVGFLLDGIFIVLSSLSQSFTMLLVFKFLGGFIINGPFGALPTYLSEFHCTKYRPKVQMMRGMIISCSDIILPLLAWAVLPNDIHIELFNKQIVLHSWNLYLLLCSIPALISGFFFMFLPESPKFLMTMRRREEALVVFRKVYQSNTGKSAEDFPIKSLVDEIQSETITPNRSTRQAFKEGLHQIKSLYFPPHLKNIVLVCSINSMFMFGTNTLKLWIPTIFQSISDYQHYHNGTTDTLCTMIQILQPRDESSSELCTVNFSSAVYINTMVPAGVSICGYIVASLVINKVGKKLLIGSLSLMGGVCAFGLYFSQNTPTVLGLSSVILAVGGICGNTLITIVIDLFPTSLRMFALSMVMATARLSLMAGNLIFPILLTLGCAPPFATIGTAIIGCGVIAAFLPNTELKALD